jgi:hypothetical protein
VGKAYQRGWDQARLELWAAKAGSAHQVRPSSRPPSGERLTIADNAVAQADVSSFVCTNEPRFIGFEPTSPVRDRSVHAS